MNMNYDSGSKVRANGAGYRLIRQLHLWIGAWGAIAAIVFGFSGLVLNHRFALEIPQGDRAESEPVRINVPVAARANVEAMAQWLAGEQGMQPLMKRVRPAPGKIAIGSGSAEQPEQWSFSGGNARDGWSINYARGDASLELERAHYSWLAAVLRLHKSGGGGIAWILLGDSFALAMVLLGLSGITMWARGRSARGMLVSVLGASSAVLALVLGSAFF
jgi:uncharacterized protein